VCRNAERGAAAVEAVKAASGNADVSLRICDVSSIAACRALGREYVASGEPLHVLVNNAGARRGGAPAALQRASLARGRTRALPPPTHHPTLRTASARPPPPGVLLNERQTSAEGHDLNFATNTLGCFALTLALEPALSRSPPARVVFVASGGMLTAALDSRHLQNADLKPYDGSVAYARDKRRQVALAERFAARWQAAGAGVAAFSMHPGWADTEGVQTSIPAFHKAFHHKLRSLEQGADTIVWLAAAAADALQPGAFYLDRAPAAKHLPLARTHYGEKEVDALWERLTALLDASPDVAAAQ